MEKPITKTKISIGIWIIVIFGFLLFGSIATYLGIGTFSVKYADPVGFVIVLFFAGFGIFSLISPLITYRYSFYKNEFVRSLPISNKKKRIPYSDINSVTIIYDEEKYSSNYLLILTNSQGFRISSWGNNIELIESLLNEKSRTTNQFAARDFYLKRKLKRLFQSLIVIISLILVIGLYTLSRPTVNIKPESLISINGIISDSVYKTVGKNQRIPLLLTNYRNIDFSISGEYYTHTYVSDFIKNFKKGDSIFLDILKTEYDLKILKNKKPTFSEKINYAFIDAYGIRDVHGYPYFSLSSFNESHRNDKSYTVYTISGLLIFFFILFRIDYIKIKKKLYQVETEQLESLYETNPYN